MYGITTQTGVKMKLLAITLITLLGLTQLTHAQSFTVDHPQLVGNGCPTGSAQAAVLSDGSTVSVIFDQYSISGRKGSNPWDQMRKFCRFIIPVNVPAGYNIQATSITYRGFASLPSNSRGIIMTSGPMANPMDLVVGDMDIRTEMRNTEQEFTITQPIPQNHSDACRPTTRIEFVTAMQLFGPHIKAPLYLMADSQINIDSTDIGGTEEPIRITFKMSRCN